MNYWPKPSVYEGSSHIAGPTTQAREASAAAGAAVFTKDFKDETKNLIIQANRWLTITAGLAVATLLFAVAVWLFPISGDDAPTIIQRFGGKLAALVVLFSATLWCGRTYKALRHLSTVNGHRALSLQTFQAFSHAASDLATKDAVLMEATRAVFGGVPTGFLDGKGGPEQDVKIVEIAKLIGAKASAG